MNCSGSTLPKTSALILAGGEGEQLFPLTASRPTPALPFGGVSRIVDFTLANCLRSGLADVGLLTQYRRDYLDAYVRHYWSDVWEEAGRQFISLPPTSGKRYRGTADAVFQNLPVIQPRKPEFVLILSGSQVYNVNYESLLRQHAETGADVTIGVIEHPIENAPLFDAVEVDDDFKVMRLNKATEMSGLMPHGPATALVCMGIYVFRMEVLEKALREHCDRGFGYDFSRDIIPSLIQSARVHAFDFRDETGAPSYWRDIKTIDSYYDANMDLVGTTPAFNPYYQSTFGAPRLLAGVHPQSNVGHSVSSPDVQIEAGAHVQSAVLMAGVRVGKEARIRRAIIEEGVHIPSGFQIGWDVEHDRKHYPISPAGVVVVKETPKASMPTLVFVGRRKEKTSHRAPVRAAA